MRSASAPLRTLVLPALALFACQPPAEEAAPPMTAEQIRSEIDAIRDAWVAAEAADDAAACAALYTDDAVYLGPSGDIARGRAAIQSNWEQSFPASAHTQVSVLEFGARGDVAYELGEWAQEITAPDGAVTPMAGFYTVVAERGADGAWKIRHHTSMLPTPMEPAG